MFKAAVEYTMGDQITARSLRDRNSLIEKTILDVHSKISKPRANIQIFDKFGTEELVDKPSTALPATILNPRKITKDLLVKCNVIRSKN
jgi:hypothetical protein